MINTLATSGEGMIKTEKTTEGEGMTERIEYTEVLTENIGRDYLPQTCKRTAEVETWMGTSKIHFVSLSVFGWPKRAYSRFFEFDAEDEAQKKAAAIVKKYRGKA